MRNFPFFGQKSAWNFLTSTLLWQWYRFFEFFQNLTAAICNAMCLFRLAISLNIWKFSFPRRIWQSLLRTSIWINIYCYLCEFHCWVNAAVVWLSGFIPIKFGWFLQFAMRKIEYYQKKLSFEAVYEPIRKNRYLVHRLDECLFLTKLFLIKQTHPKKILHFIYSNFQHTVELRPHKGVYSWITCKTLTPCISFTEDQNHCAITFIVKVMKYSIPLFELK